MTKKIPALIILVALFTISFYSSSAATPYKTKTTWTVVNKSLTDLLNDGWQVIGHSSSRIASNPTSIPDSTGTRSIITDGFNEQKFNFMLFKNGKYIFCIITDPDILTSTFSGCRSLN